MTDSIAGQTITTDLDAELRGNTPAPVVSGATRRILNPVTQRVVEKAIQDVLSEYVKKSKRFTADSMHELRSNITDLVKQRLGEDEITTVDLGLDLSAIQEIPFFFQVNVPEIKMADHFIEIPVEEGEIQVPAGNEAKTAEEFQKLLGDGK